MVYTVYRYTSKIDQNCIVLEGPPGKSTQIQESLGSNSEDNHKISQVKEHSMTTWCKTKSWAL